MLEVLQKISLKIDDLIKVLTPPKLLINLNFWSTVVLAITLAFLIWYTFETHKLATLAKDANLRPVVLRSGFISNWDDLQYTFKSGQLKTGKPIEFTILKNIATSIRGFIVKNGKRYELLFGNNISNIGKDNISFSKQWGWMKPETQIYALFNEVGQESKMPNQIVIQYKDIEGNPYYSIEDVNFDQKSFKGKFGS